MLYGDDIIINTFKVNFIIQHMAEEEKKKPEPTVSSHSHSFPIFF